MFRILLLLLCAAPVEAQETFFAPAAPQGQVVVALHPTEVVAPLAVTRVTFGLPLPRGSLTQAGLASVKVLRDNVEIPAHVAQLVPWRHRTSAGIDGQSVRIAVIQINVAFAQGYPSSSNVTVQWGGTARTLDLPALLDPRAAWHLVTTGSFQSSDNVFEPDVYAVLPRTWMAQGLYTSMRSTPFDPANTNVRDDPSAMDAIAHWPGYQESERAFKNNFYTIINQDPSTTGTPVPYRTSATPWLYDRAAAMFRLYFRSGSFAALREGVRHAQFYAGRQDVNGFFTLTGAANDSKYAYNEHLAYAWWTTGDPQMPEKIARTVLAQANFPAQWSLGSSFWTERHAAFKLLASVIAYEALGGNTYRDSVEQLLGYYRAHQDGASGQVPSPRVDGGLYTTGQQRDPDEFADYLTTFVASSWMSALLSDAAVRAYGTGEDAATAQFVARLGDFLAATIEQYPNHYFNNTTLATPRWALTYQGGGVLNSDLDADRALEVAAQIAWARWFREQLGGDGSALRPAALDLYETFDVGVNVYIQGSSYAVIPANRWAKEFRTADGLEFALALDEEIFSNGFESP